MSITNDSMAAAGGTHAHRFLYVYKCVVVNAHP